MEDLQFYSNLLLDVVSAVSSAESSLGSLVETKKAKDPRVESHGTPVRKRRCRLLESVVL
jgi:hypothetical protein